jgi:2-amino-4-hydroxy-6-hydroxymethyldihydropteridine diphosphokinase
MVDQSVVVFIAYGTNVLLDGTPERQSLPYINAELKSRGVNVSKFSRLWLSRAWPDPNDPPYRNAILKADTKLSPEAVLENLHEIEAEAGRRRDGRANTPRTLDLDLIAWDKAVIDRSGLILPHPRAHDRAFVMGPLSEIEPDWLHPVLNKTAAELYRTATVARDAHPIQDLAMEN